MEIKKVPISKVDVWEKNLLTRATKTEGFERTKKQIEKLKVYKPLLVFKQDGKFKILGGRTRFFALKALQHSDVDISIVYPKTEAEKWEYALSDNDHSGDWIEEKLAEELFPLQEEINLEDYKIDVGNVISMKDVLADYAPDEEDMGRDIPIPLKLTQKQLLANLKKFDNIVVEFSGGKDSTAALLWAQKACKQINKAFVAVFVETGAEFPDLSSYISRFCLDRGIKLVRLWPKCNITEYYLEKRVWPDSIYRPCLHKFIVKPIEDYIKTLEGKTVRVRGGRKTQKTPDSKSNTIHEMKGGRVIMNPFFSIDEDKYAKFLEEIKDVLWPGYKKGFVRTACWMCPFQLRAQWEALRRHYPLLWEEMKVLTKRIRYARHKGDSTGKRFRTYWNNLN